MLILGLDTTGALVTAAVHDGDGLRAERSERAPRGHAERLAPLAAEALAAAGSRPGELTHLAVGVGPGPFTGLRVAIATGAVMAHALGIEAVGVCSLDALADAAVLAGEVTGAGTRFVAATDARRREVYSAVYEIMPGDDAGPAWARSAWARRVEGPDVGAPDLVRALGLPIVGRVVADVERDVTGGDVARVAVRGLRSAGGPAAGRLTSLTPLYLRRPDAQEPGARKKVLT